MIHFINNKKIQKGFTLIELLVVIGILAVLLAITLIAINPARQFSQANNTQRASDVNAILNAVGQYAVENNGDLSALAIPVGSASAVVVGSNTAGGQLDFCPDIVPTYIAEMPVDPQTGTWVDCTNYSSNYTIFRSATDSRITVSAPNTEIPPAAEVISVTR
ncbi:MAG: prepilin-type N-terminal cleavage/methylation domain-containing protein [Candidatus Levybacteria bacterium]|nr:prepilin-type N-terminal cleavage/methylation domain-containing protein [Candidatus Levybacteria bacterium]